MKFQRKIKTWIATLAVSVMAATTALAGPAGDTAPVATGPAAGPGGVTTTEAPVFNEAEFIRAQAAGSIAKGIDVSYWNQYIDWFKVKQDGVDFAILATRFRGAEDPFFKLNALYANQAGIRIGAYIYSYATNVAEAEAEADFILSVIKDQPITFPVVFDVEDANTVGTVSREELSKMINIFCQKVSAAGYTPMIYANEYWIANKIDMTKVPCDVWVAKYQQRYTYTPATIWQCSNKGRVKGVDGNVDIDYLYKSY